MFFPKFPDIYVMLELRLFLKKLLLFLHMGRCGKIPKNSTVVGASNLQKLITILFIIYFY